MELSSDFIKKNQHFLRSCILYEVLQKKPILISYGNFCNTVGKDAMNYPDFEFWYYRFYHGNRELNYDRNVDPEPKTLVDMPVVLMKKITQHLDPVERTFLRSMNHAIKDVADSFPPVFEKIEISISDTSVNWKLNNHSFSCAKEDGGCTLYKPNSSEAEESDECYMEKGIEKLALLLKTPDIQVDHLSLTVSNKLPNCADLLPMLFNAKSVFIYGRTAKIVVQFLSAMTPGYLESISLDGMYSEEMEYYGMIFKSDQFKQAKNVEFNMVTEFDVEDLVRFSHLKKFKCFLKSENAFEDVPRIRDIEEEDYHCRVRIVKIG
ncbi:unnamed protein product [Caenorhabditis nigoni]